MKASYTYNVWLLHQPEKAQIAERLAVDQEVVSATLTLGIKPEEAEVDRRVFVKHEVAGANPVPGIWVGSGGIP